MMANDFLDHILQQLPLPQHKVDLVKKHAQTFIALCATGIVYAVKDGLGGKLGTEVIELSGVRFQFCFQAVLNTFLISP